MSVGLIDILSSGRLLVEKYITDEHLILVIVIVVALGVVGWLSRKRFTRLKAWCAGEKSFLGFVLLFVILLLFIWCLQWFWKTPSYCRAARDLTKDEYLTGANVVGPICEELVGQILRVGKKKYATIGVEDVRTLETGHAIVPIALPNDLSLGAGLAVGLCVDVLKPQQEVASSARVATFVPLTPDRKLVFLEVTKSEDIKNLTSVAGALSSGAADTANKVTMVGSACAETTATATPTATATASATATATRTATATATATATRTPTATPIPG
jgi:hypothetical protein